MVCRTEDFDLAQMRVSAVLVISENRNLQCMGLDGVHSAPAVFVSEIEGRFFWIFLSLGVEAQRNAHPGLRLLELHELNFMEVLIAVAYADAKLGGRVRLVRLVHAAEPNFADLHPPVPLDRYEVRLSPVTLPKCFQITIP